MQGNSQISAVVDRYFEGLYKGDVDLLRSVFHPQAQLFGEVRGKPYHNTLDGYLTAVAGRPSPHAKAEPFEMQLLSVEVVNQVASVRARCPMLGLIYIDFLSLANDGTGWRIVNKTFTHVDA
ncbi:hypothetical protein HNQ60_000040 [Povalibacter uvarum]|uniref:Nuclear transport factor 2 family protein n=1 Tax=Povalibacter uvarum TaxID=732238 RepID=A0A841HF40_9GAMM|nr:nuclear transport factor 2 family protein [Povalibacter uvarum]MBB6091194.1 hypothetical protein [Povalibacter uvarum]